MKPTLEQFMKARPHLSKKTCRKLYEDTHGPNPTMRDIAVYPKA
jgi:hypothetical protein